MNISQLSEQLKDVPQGTLINYARDPNSVVPQFLALAEIQRRQHLQTAGQGQPPSRTVAEDVLNQANPSMVPQPQMAQPQQAQMANLPENQPGVTSLPTGMAQGMAGGGIVAFADGGEAEDDEDIEMAKLFPKRAGINIEEMLASIPSGIRGLMDKLPQSYEAEKAKVNNASRMTNFETSKRSGHPYEAQAIEVAKKVGLDPNIMLHALYKETGGHKDPANAVSKAGAFGPMQLMEAAAKEVGVNRKDVYDNLLGGARYLKKQVDAFQDPYLGLAAYNAGPGRVRQMLKRGEGIESLKPETQNYIRMAQGGIAHFAKGDEVTDDDNEYLNRSRAVVENAKDLARAFTTPENYNPITKLGIDQLPSIYQKYIGAPTERFFSASPEEQAASFNAAKASNLNIPFVSSAQAAPSVQPVPTELSRENARMIATANANQRDIAAGKLQGGNVPAGQPLATPVVRPNMSLDGRQNPETYGLSGNFLQAPEPTTPIEMAAPKSKVDEYFEGLAKDIQERAAQAKENGDMNKYLAIMQAGFAMMGGQSPYAMTNIGKGAEQGVSTYGALRKQTSDELKDIAATRLGLAKYSAAKEGADKDAAIKEQYNKEIIKLRNAAENKKLSEEDQLLIKFESALSRNSQILEINKAIAQERADGTLTPYRYEQYQANKDLVTRALAKKYKVDPEISVKLPAVMDPIKPKSEPWYKFGSSTPAPTLNQGQQDLLNKYNQ